MDAPVLDDEDRTHLRAAIALAARARASGNPPFGSLLVGADGTVLAEDVNTTRTERDITAHPELKLARRAALKPPGFVNADAAAVIYDGPALFEEARQPVAGYYA